MKSTPAMIGNAALLDGEKIAFLSSRKVPPKVEIVTRGRVCSFVVDFADGTHVDGGSAANSFVEALRHAGLKKVIDAGFTMSGEPLVSPVRHAKYSSQSRETPEGYFIQCHSSTNSKVRLLERIFKTNFRLNGDRYFLRSSLFGFQRYFGKWGGEHVPECDRENALKGEWRF